MLNENNRIIRLFILIALLITALCPVLWIHYFFDKVYFYQKEMAFSKKSVFRLYIYYFNLSARLKKEYYTIFYEYQDMCKSKFLKSNFY